MIFYSFNKHIIIFLYIVSIRNIKDLDAEVNKMFYLPTLLSQIKVD